MSFVVKITSFLYRYLNGRDEKNRQKTAYQGGPGRVLEECVLGGLLYYNSPTLWRSEHFPTTARGAHSAARLKTLIHNRARATSSRDPRIGD